jgi:succinoglycan biosynthesis transport protein ExoP
LNAYQFLQVLWGRRGIFLTLLLATVLATAVASLLMPKTYVATTALLIDDREEQSLSGPQASSRYQTGYMQTQVDILTSRKVAKKVVEDMQLAGDPAWRKAFEAETGGRGAIEDWLADALLLQVKIEVTQSGVMLLEFRSREPRFTAAVANAFAQAYIDTSLELKVEPNRRAAVWFDEQLLKLRASLEAAQSKLTAYQAEKGVVAGGGRIDHENERLSEITTQLTRIQGEQHEILARQRQARELVANGASPGNLPEVLSNPFIQGLKSELLRSETKLRELASQLGVNHPQYQRQLVETRSHREKLDSEMSRVVGGLDNAMRQGNQREAGLLAALAAQKKQMLDQNQARYEVATQVREVESAQKAYETALQRATMSELGGGARQTNVAVLSAATAPLFPFRPRIRLNIALSVVIGVMLGAAAVFLRELSDQKLRSLSTIPADLGVPLLGVLSGQLTDGRVPARLRLK